MSRLTFENVTVRFGALTAVNDVSLDVPDGMVVGLVGESGSGKTTLARAGVGLTPMQVGRVLLDGVPIPKRGSAGRVQMVFQDPYSSLDPRMRVGDAIAEALPTPIARADRDDHIAHLLDLVNLNPAIGLDYPARLSGGQRQRVAIARALAAQPAVLIADEITSALDVSIQGSILNLIRRLQTELGLTMLFVSHNLAVVRYVAQRMAVMRDGIIVEEGPTAEILEHPHDPYTKELLAAIPGSHLPPKT
ncbi:MAG: ATP-binding cassette domain-containing protein [Propionibacteriaceae bacterium]|jgi:peptide/nickel transport system ATP-binding protein|nr:ATP-binding cassette domain-containing protein [Propionibacteriaceae bacterium]